MAKKTRPTASAATDADSVGTASPSTSSGSPSPRHNGSANAGARKKRRKKSSKGNKRKPKAVRTRESTRISGRQRPFPFRTLEEALSVPRAIREKNNGNDWDSEDVAQAAMGVSKKSNKFFYIAAASRDYGLTTGSRDTDRIGLAPLGREIFFAGDEVTKRQKMIEAFFSVDTFKKVYDHYGSGHLPEDQYLNNTLLKEFSLPTEFHAEFRRIFEANCKFLAIDSGFATKMASEGVTRTEHGADIRVVGEAKGKFDRTAFVIMPFVEKGPHPRPEGFFKEVLTRLVTPAANQAGFAVETAEQDGSDVIQSTIINQLLKPDNLVIADLTDHNPNVLFELGIRIAKEFPVALIKSGGTGRIFDVDNMMRVLEYSANLWPSTVETDLPKLSKHIKAAWDNSTTGKNYMQILVNAPIGSLVEGKPLSTRAVAGSV